MVTHSGRIVETKRAGTTGALIGWANALFSLHPAGGRPCDAGAAWVGAGGGGEAGCAGGVGLAPGSFKLPPVGLEHSALGLQWLGLPQFFLHYLAVYLWRLCWAWWGLSSGMGLSVGVSQDRGFGDRTEIEP
jgi:hypothetical protein